MVDREKTTTAHTLLMCNINKPRWWVFPCTSDWHTPTHNMPINAPLSHVLTHSNDRQKNFPKHLSAQAIVEHSWPTISNKGRTSILGDEMTPKMRGIIPAKTLTQ